MASTTLNSPPEVSSAPPGPPIAAIIPVVSAFASLLASTSTTIFWHLWTLASSLYRFSPHHPIIYVSLPVLRYLFAPFAVLFEIILEAFIWTPWNLAVGALENLYPIYVLCGIACLVGSFLGLFGRLASAVLIGVVLEDSESKPQPVVQEDEKAASLAHQGE
ncbi:hypothetical protein CCMSSC00406_0002630 [Pleurotus cornucopiae]|uniref:Uncharacterized protein n=1 Tax=Pleurotus cornucopiae TaxID=5321 RepID=A0ACB7ISS8_PLECO|nr:hypothetical protein CCMSSC00406_0002630 [Pleurotus cornucopiae]